MDNEQFAWREILLRIFEGFGVRKDTSPEWLVNPNTGRPLKLNYLFPDIHVGVRLEGLRSRRQRQGPDELERMQQEQRERAREDLCASHGIHLLRFDVYDTPKDIFRAIQATLAWAMRQTAKAEIDPNEKLRRMEQLRQARRRYEEIRQSVRSSQNLQTWAELWIDRMYRETRSDSIPRPRGPLPRYALNMRVRHPSFGTGRVIGLSDENGDQIVTVRFDSGDEKQFLAQLVVDKLRPC